MTGVEAGQQWRESISPAGRRRTRRRALSLIIGILMLMLAGIAWLAHDYGIGATDPGEKGYESVLSQLMRAMAGKGFFYYVSMGSILAVLALSANTAFADFPRLCQMIAHDGYLPHAFSLAAGGWCSRTVSTCWCVRPACCSSSSAGSRIA